MLKRMMLVVACASMFSTAAQAAWKPTGKTRFDLLGPMSGSPGQLVTFTATVYYEVKDGRKDTPNRWLPLSNGKVRWAVKMCGISGSKTLVGPVLSNEDGVATCTWEIPSGVKRYQNASYSVQYLRSVTIGKVLLNSSARSGDAFRVN